MVKVTSNAITFVMNYKKDKNMKEWLCFICTFSALAIGFIALYTPPTGIIDSSVLWFTAQLLVFVAALLGINLKFPSLDAFNKNSAKPD